MDNKVISDPIKRIELRKELFLFVMGLRDILIAQSFFDQIKDIQLNKIVDSNIAGMTYGFIICYGRIFHKNDQLGKINFESIKNKLSQEEKQIHNTLMCMRNQDYAHNDPKNNTLHIYYDKKNKKISAIANLNYAFLADYNKTIPPLLIKIKRIFEQKRDELLAKLFSHDSGYQVNEKQSFLISFSPADFIENPIRKLNDE